MSDEFLIDEQQEDVPAKAEWPGMWVLVCGLATSAATLGLLALSNRHWPDFQPMGWYINLVIPVGAILVGLAAGSGYGIASLLSHTKIGGKLLVVVVVLQICCYFLAQYQDYKSIRDLLGAVKGQEVTFIEYFDWATRSFAFNDDDGDPGKELGAWGYGIRLLEVVGFCLGSLIVPAITMAKPYCDRCRKYMMSRNLCVLPAGIVPKKIKKKDTAANDQQNQEIQAALERGQALVLQLKQWVDEQNSDALAECFSQHQPNTKEVEKQTARTRIVLEHCAECRGGRLVVTMVTGQANEVTELAKEEWELSPEVVEALSSSY